MRKTVFFAFFLWIHILFAAEPIPPELKGVNVIEHLAQKLPLELEFIDEQDQKVPLSKYFESGKPTILALVYYSCPNICHYLFDGLVTSLRNLSWPVGKEFQVIAISIHPPETAQLAQEKKQKYLKMYGRESTEGDWHFLRGSEGNIQKIAEVVGFSYKYDPDQKQYAHPAVIYILTPEASISRYLYGISVSPGDIKLALLEASQGKIGNIVDRLLMFCYHYNPKGRRYALAAINVMKAGGVVTVILLGFLIFFLMRRKK